MPAPRGLVQRIDQELHKSALMPRGGGLLVAVSGGADSVALLRLLCEINQSAYWRWKLVVGHVDHGLRGAASRADAAFVKKLAKKMGLPFAGTKLRLKKSASEDAARQGRIRALRIMAAAHRCSAVVMAHHADDQAQTVLMRMFRGCGIAGLASMSAQTVLSEKGARTGLTIHRPLLNVRRSELRDYLKRIGQDWREDRSNDSPRFLRNRVRHEVLPVIQRVWPGAIGALGRLAQVALMMDRAMDVFAAHSMPHPEFSRDRRRVSVRRDILRGLPPALVIHFFRQVIFGLGGTPEIADYERLMAAARAVFNEAGGIEIQMGRGITIALQGNLVLIRRDRVRRPR